MQLRHHAAAGRDLTQQLVDECRFTTWYQLLIQRAVVQLPKRAWVSMAVGPWLGGGVCSAGRPGPIRRAVQAEGPSARKNNM